MVESMSMSMPSRVRVIITGTAPSRSVYSNTSMSARWYRAGATASHPDSASHSHTPWMWGVTPNASWMTMIAPPVHRPARP